MVDDTHAHDSHPDPHGSRALKAALALVGKGYFVAPVIIRRDPRTGKKLGDYLGIRWHDQSTDDPAQVLDWYVQYGDRLSYLVDTGRSGAFVVDLDVTAEATGEAVWNAANLPLGAMVVRTPGGGYHHWFRQPAGESLTVHKRIHGHPIDVRADGGHVYAPGAVVLGPGDVPELRGYELLGPIVPAAELTPLPTVVAEFLKASKTSAKRRPEAQGEVRTRSWVIATAGAQLEKVKGFPRREGSGFRSALLGAALVLGRLVAAGMTTEVGAVTRLERAAAMVWGRVDADDRRWIRHGLEDGIADPWTVVPDDWDTTVPRGLGQSITSMINSTEAVTDGETTRSEPVATFSVANGDGEAVDVVTGAAVLEAPAAGPVDQLAELDDGVDSWEPVGADALAAILDGTVRAPEPAVGVVRADGARFLYPGLEHAVIGEAEAGKSWFALACVAAELKAGHRVAYLHFEEADATSTVLRLHRQFAVERSVILERFLFVGPERRVTVTDVDRILAAGVPVLVVIDGVNEAMALHGMPIYDPEGAAEYRRKLVKPFKRAGAAVVSLDHVPKDQEGRSAGVEFGSVMKGNGLDGARIVLENVDPFGDGRRGISRVYVTKDRHGQLRKLGQQSGARGANSRKTFVGTMVIDAQTPGAWDFAFRAPAPDGSPDNSLESVREEKAAADLRAEVLEAVRFANVTLRMSPTVSDIRAHVKKRRNEVVEALADLVKNRELTLDVGARGSKSYSVTVTRTQ